MVRLQPELQYKSSQIAFVEKRVEKMQGSAYHLYETAETIPPILPQTLLSPQFQLPSICPVISQ